MSERQNGLSPDQLRAVKILAGAESDGTDVVGSDPETAAGWLQDDPEFIGALNRAKSFRRERLRADVRSLASAAMATLRELVRPGVASSVRLRASLAILQAADALNVEEIGPTSAEGVEAKLDDKRFIESLGG
jgi:5'-3' exonuclease